ncbi:MAG: hypothetical protein EYC67_13005 [Betaproteobacteria bacterium]|nr:MAG: hypothetical protein EYC67_13005 [Betaproteobacteria bacterium]
MLKGGKSMDVNTFAGRRGEVGLTPPRASLTCSVACEGEPIVRGQGLRAGRLRKLARRLFPVIAATCFSPALAEEIFQRETVDGVVVWLQVTPSQGHATTPLGESEHRIVALLRERTTGHPIADAAVAVEVARKGRIATRWPLAPGFHGNDPAYVGQVPMTGRGTAYRLRLQFRQPGDAEALEAEFRYNHH